jgi:hypothetical protein
LINTKKEKENYFKNRFSEETTLRVPTILKDEFDITAVQRMGLPST